MLLLDVIGDYKMRTTTEYLKTEVSLYLPWVIYVFFKWPFGVHIGQTAIYSSKSYKVMSNPLKQCLIQ